MTEPFYFPVQIQFTILKILWDWKASGVNGNYTSLPVLDLLGNKLFVQFSCCCCRPANNLHFW
jgi:hypothetical protein